MKNLKKLLAVIVAICVLATFTVPAFAEETTAAKTDAEIATELGVILGEGGGVTADYLASQPTRLQGAIMFLRLKGLEGAAKAFTGTDNFEDVSVVNDTNKAILAYLKANPDLGFQGVGNNTFAPLKEMTAKEYYKILLVALGYEENTDFTWANVLSFAAGKGLVKLIDNEKFTVNDLCIGTVEALKATVKGGTDTLIAKLVEGNSISSDKAVASGLYNPVAKALEVVSATADTLKTAKVVFNKELDADTITAANFENTDVTVAPKLLDDKKTVVVVFNTTKSQSATADIVVANVKSTDGTVISKVTKTVTFVDTTIPVISGVVAKNAKSLVISASEPMDFKYDYPQILSGIKIDGSAAIAATVVDYAKNTVTLNLVSALAAGTHKVEISGMADYAKYTAVAASFSVDVAADTTAPAIASAELKNLTTIKVTFNEDIDPLYKGSFWVNSSSVDSLNVVQDSADPSVFTLTVAEQTISALVQINVEYKNQKDVVGNEVTSKTSYVFKVNDDTALPTVSASIASDSDITLTFSKTMLVAGTIKVYDVTNSATLKTLKVGDPGVTFKANTNNTEIELSAATLGIAGKDPISLKLTITDMTDGTVRKNALGEQNITLTTKDTLTPSISDGCTVTAGTTYKTDYVTFYFSEAMDTTTLTNLSSYVMTGAGTNGAISSYGASVKSVASDQKSISITIPGIATSTPDFVIYAMKDLAGNMLIASPVISVGAASTPLQLASLSSVTATAVNKIAIEFNQAVGKYDPSTFVVKDMAGNTTAWAIGYTISATKVTITLNRNLDTDPAGKYQIGVNDASKVSNLFGTTLSAISGETTYAIADKVSPSVSVAKATTAGQITLTFSEPVTAATSAAAIGAVIVKNSDGYVALNTSNVLLYNAAGAVVPSLSGSEYFTKMVLDLGTTNTYTVEVLPINMTDAATNKVASLAATSITTN